MVKKISGKEFQLAESSKAAVVDFSAVWCGPCAMLSPILDELSDELEGEVDFFNVDVDENMDLTMKFGISSIPALVFLKSGEKADMTIGFQPKEALKNWIEQNK